MQKKSLVFLSYILNCTPDDMQITNAIIQSAAGYILPSGAEVVIAECIASPALAAKFSELTAKRQIARPAPQTIHKGKSRAEIREAARVKREAAEATRKTKKRNCASPLDTAARSPGGEMGAEYL